MQPLTPPVLVLTQKIIVTRMRPAYGGLNAKLEQIGADSITDEKREKESYYIVTLRTDKNFIGTKERPMPIIPGMVATVDILVGKNTILSYLLKPVLKAKYMALRER